VFSLLVEGILAVEDVKQHDDGPDDVSDAHPASTEAKTPVQVLRACHSQHDQIHLPDDGLLHRVSLLLAEPSQALGHDRDRVVVMLDLPILELVVSELLLRGGCRGHFHLVRHVVVRVSLGAAWRSSVV
jgi:hypothetical protein